MSSEKTPVSTEALLEKLQAEIRRQKKLQNELKRALSAERELRNENAILTEVLRSRGPMHLMAANILRSNDQDRNTAQKKGTVKRAKAAVRKVGNKIPGVRSGYRAVKDIVRPHGKK
ncbi:MAG: hypothetical protein ACTHZ5_07920 [Micrococcaceae bacterium]